MPATSSIQSQVLPHLKDLSPKLRTAAEFVLAHPEEIATRSLRQVSRTANLTPPTFSRLARALNFATYDDLRETCRHELKRRNQMLADKAQTLLQMSSSKNSKDRSGVVFSHAQAAIDNIQTMMHCLDLDRLHAAADALAKARKVVLFGTTSGLAMVNYFSCMAKMAFKNWHVAGADGAMWATQIADLGSRDAVFVVSLAPHAARPVQAMRAAYDAGAKVIAITDNPDAPFLEFVTTCFFIETGSPQFFPSHVVPLLLIEGLMGMVVRRSGQSAAKNIRDAEAMGQKLEEYWNE